MTGWSSCWPATRTTWTGSCAATPAWPRGSAPGSRSPATSPTIWSGSRSCWPYSAGDSFDPPAVEVLKEIFAHACEAGRIDELGNGRFARSLFERACASRDVRVVRLGEQAATAEDLTTVTAADLQAAYRDLAVSDQG